MDPSNVALFGLRLWLGVVMDRADLFWNDTTFNGASLSHSDILDSDDHLQTALTFVRQAHERLIGRAA